MIYIRDKKSAYNRKTLVRLFVHEKPETYHDAECNSVQCRAGAFRSVTELLEIVQTYFPQTSLLDILKIIRQLTEEGENISLIWCTQVNKVVLKYVDPQFRAFMSQYSLDRYKRSKGVDGYSIQDYQNMLNNN